LARVKHSSKGSPREGEVREKRIEEMSSETGDSDALAGDGNWGRGTAAKSSGGEVSMR